MKRKIISAGHICLDITPVFPEGRTYADLGEVLVPGKLIHLNGTQIHTGGSVSNTGLALSVLGADVSLLGKIGDDAFGRIVERIFAEHGVRGLIRDSASSTAYTIVLAIPGIDRIFLHDPGANDTFSGADIPEEELAEAVLFHFGYPSLMKGMYERDGAELVSIFSRVRSLGIATSLDLADVDPASAAGKADWRRILENILPLADFFVPSYEDVSFLFGKKAEGAERLEAAGAMAEEFIRMGAKIVLIKCGTAGMVCRTAGREQLKKIGPRLGLDAAAWADKKIVQKSFRADRVLSATGAGDSAVAAFLKAAADGRGPEDAVRLASAEGACAVTSYDALSGLRTLEELEERIAGGWEVNE